MENLKIIDTIGPFAAATDKPILNWSKIPFQQLEQRGVLSKKTQEKIIKNFELYIKKISEIGYTGISIDDLAHLVLFNFYSTSLKKLLNDYQNLYHKLFAIVEQSHIQIFVNTDYMFFNKSIEEFTKVKSRRVLKFFTTSITQLFLEYPEISGVIVRIGESDGLDIKENFVSKLQLKTPRQANKFLKTLIPIFEKNNKTLIFRTWSAGVYKIGDLIWNPKTFDKVFSSIKSESLIIGMKYGDTDFFRYLSLNPLFFRSEHKKIIELQTKREWEGMGMFPSFIGWDIAQYHKELQSNKKFIGIHVWCQTGGWSWSSWKSLTFLENSSLWNELNTYVTVSIFTDKISVEEAILKFCSTKNIVNSAQFINLLKLSEKAIKDGLYIREFAEKTLYFRRVRIPPLSWITWNKIQINPLIKALFQYTVKNTDKALQEGFGAVEAIKEMIHIAEELSLDSWVRGSLSFQLATFTLLAKLRIVLLSSIDKKKEAEIKKVIQGYQGKFPEHYIPLITAWKKHFRKSKKMNVLFRLTVRHAKNYRGIDKFNLYITPAQKFLVMKYVNKFFPFLSNQAMGMEQLFA